MDLIFAAVVVLSASSLGIPLFQVAAKKEKRWISGYVLVVALLSALAIVAFNSVAPQSDPAFKNLLISDSLGNFFAIVTVSVALFVAVASLEAIRKSDNAPIYYGLLSFTALGMLLLSFTQDLLMLFVSWELMSLPTYVLAGFDKKRVQSNEASVKYAILGAMSSAILLYAISLTYGLTGTTQIIPAVRAIAAQPFSLATSIAILLFVAGFGFKMSIVPFHMWIPDAYEGAPTTVSTLLAAATKKAGFVAAIRVLLAVTTVYVITQNPIFTMANILAVLALLTMTLGNAAALTQRSMTRLLAYSSIAQAGYILVGFVAYAYGLQTNAYSQQTNAYFTEAVPPLNGFWSKLLLFLSVINGPFAWLAVAGIVNSAFSLGYYAWVIKRIYIDEPESNEKVKEPIPFIVVFGVAVGLMIGLGLFPQQVINFASSAVPNIFPR